MSHSPLTVASVTRRRPATSRTITYRGTISTPVRGMTPARSLRMMAAVSTVPMATRRMMAEKRMPRKP
ncbi:hypothetical protein BPSY_2201 [Bifidobacterium psychraerophilum]|uniref:Uncharacterized protein n=1 Tax=Bifidobacterium psychraerophilum TaxID=218140 RepID=A0A087CM22_9BIFI|nr:hypothetical protein BPSY_2201 [Bifidobacterium psychraerophilum]